jgi:hypothetical protein
MIVERSAGKARQLRSGDEACDPAYVAGLRGAQPTSIPGPAGPPVVRRYAPPTPLVPFCGMRPPHTTRPAVCACAIRWGAERAVRDGVDGYCSRQATWRPGGASGSDRQPTGSSGCRPPLTLENTGASKVYERSLRGGARRAGCLMGPCIPRDFSVSTIPLAPNGVKIRPDRTAGRNAGCGRNAATGRWARPLSGIFRFKWRPAVWLNAAWPAGRQL